VSSPPGRAIALLWLAWGLYWWWSSRTVKRVRRRESAGSRALHLVPLALAAALLMAPTVPGWLGGRWLPDTAVAARVGVTLVAAGLMFSVWARAVLGGNWSASVTLKVDHAIVRTGPYRCVRHPIYTGLLLGFVGSAIALGEWRGLVAVAIAAAALWRKLKVEERWLTEEFGARYAEYRRRTPALIPFLF
jgi:protein-S-isoprenylcysteine O-methyltransferase Ste14